ncbi:hypothetical protein MJ563_04745 [Klebsiella pneumoniae]|nr:hypothetical protein MJ563_04745 [Klebsiella pneumoniae]
MHTATKLRSTLDEAIERAIYMVKRARNRYPTTLSSPRRCRPYADCRSGSRAVEAAINAGATTTLSRSHRRLYHAVRICQHHQRLCDRVPNIDKAIISVHTHDDLGIAVCNASPRSTPVRAVEGAMNGPRWQLQALEEAII